MTHGPGRAARWAIAACALVVVGGALPLATAANGSSGHPSRPVPSAGCRVVSGSAASPGGSGVVKGLATPAISGTYRLSTPRHGAHPRPASLILLFHGFGSSPAQFSSLTDLPRRGTMAGDVVAVPHIQPGEAEWQFSGDGTDAEFVTALIASLERTFCINTAAVFATGFSAGAAFTIAYACTHETKIRAIATVAVEFQLGCRKPISILAFHGTADPEVRYQNGAVGASLPGVKVRGTQLNMGDWARLDRCRARPDKKVIGSQVFEQIWPECTGNTAVRLYTVIGGGHTWPGADPKKGFGLTTQQVNATTAILASFAAAGR